ncbi:uncharacterized protein LOC109537083 [Dendroctonus ponderosae]
MKSTTALLVIFVALALVQRSMQYVASPTCFGQVCPASTSNCKEHKKSSIDKSRIQVKITCLDDFDASVKEYYFEEASHLDRYTAYENTRYESINEGISYSPDPYKNQGLDLTPHRQLPEWNF